jgi:hypothetical protein
VLDFSRFLSLVPSRLYIQMNKSHILITSSS